MIHFHISNNMKHFVVCFIILMIFVLPARCDTPQDQKESEWVSLHVGVEIGRYFLKDSKIHVHVNGLLSEELQDADPATFLANKKNSEFGRDKSHVWFIDSVLKVDAQTWEIISDGYSKDRQHVYCGVWQLPDADPETFRILRGGLAEWGVDKNSVYSEWNKLENADPKTFQFLEGEFSKDKNNVYYHHERLDGADPNSFEIIKGNVGKDKNAIFAFGQRMPNYIDLPSVRVPGDGYIYDKNGKYYLSHGEWVKAEK